ncbi:hypothetical protein VM1G_11747 [Cytospora mali]|uniref:Uncharacterized protein n=1 Tax=Cytospora mali TaxID=578113 RepID=A0A194W6J2_CYTMA|nr:hypothetical protein VM1G_11747 [Valsa mali]
MQPPMSTSLCAMLVRGGGADDRAERPRHSVHLMKRPANGIPSSYTVQPDGVKTEDWVTNKPARKE